jgi:uncharacterized membrane protein YeiH
MWNLPPGDSVLHFLSLVALAAQAMTAALAAGRRSMDWAGVCMLGCITALGGGTIRDVLLGHYPLVWVQHPSYLAITAIAAFCTILIARVVHRLNVAFLVLDAIGLVVFTMAGCDVAWQTDASLPIVIVSGMITGCAGGVLRDILCNDVPLLFRSELYASVSVVTVASLPSPLARRSPSARHCRRNCGCSWSRRRSAGPRGPSHRPASIPCSARAAWSRSARRRG